MNGRHRAMPCAILIGTLLLSLAPLAGAGPEDDEADLEARLEQIGDTIERAMLAGDYDEVLRHFTEDAILDPGLSPALHGREAIRAQYRKIKATGLRYNSFSSRIEEVWTCGDRVYERGTFGLSIEAPQLPRPEAYSGGYFEIWRRSGTDLEIEYMIWNLDHDPRR